MKTHLLTYSFAGAIKSFYPTKRNAAKHAPNGKSPKLNFLIFLLALILLAFGQKGYSQTNTWNGGGANNWTINADWSLGHQPTASEDVVIPNSRLLNVNTAAVCKSITISGGANNTTVTITGANSLTVTNGVTINAGTSGGVQKTLNVGTGTLSCESITMAATTSDTRDCEVTLSTGTINVSDDITMDGTSARNALRFTGAGILNLGGNFLGSSGGILVPSTGTVNLTGSNNAQVIDGANTSSFYNLSVNKTASSNYVTSAALAFTVSNNLTITTGELILQATNANYTITNDVVINANGTLTHSVDWNTAGKLLSVGGSFSVNGGGLFRYTVRSHVQMNGAGTETITTGSNSSSAFSILTLINGTFNASGTIRINDNCWSMFGTGGSFHTNGQTVYANGGVLCSGGTLVIDGGTMNVTGGILVGTGVNAAATLSAGTLNTDLLTLGAGANTGAFNHSGGIANISGTLTITSTGTYTCTGSPTINIAGDWTNNKNAAGFVPASGTVNFNSTSAAQNINGTAASQTFNNISINKAGQQLSIAGSTTTINLNGSLVLTAGIFVAGTATSINVAGNWANSGTAFTAGSGTVTFNGGAAQTISGTTVTNFNNITINNANGLSLSGTDVNINGAAGALTFTNGKITTGVNKVVLGTTATTSGAGAGKYIYGNLRMGVATGTSTRVFDVGDAAVYAPVSILFNSVTVSGAVTAYTTGTEHPAITNSTINETKSVNRYWNLANNAVTMTNCTPTFNFVAADMDAGATYTNFIVGKLNGAWAYPAIGGRTATSITTTVYSFGDFACGEAGAAKPVITTETADQIACSGSSATYTSVSNGTPSPTAYWQISTDGGINFITLSISAPYAVSTTTAGANTTSVLTINPATLLMDQNQFRVIFSNSRGNDTSYDAILNMVQGPTVNAGAALSNICGSGSSDPLGGSVGGSATGGTWSTVSGGTFTPNANTLNATWTPPVGFSGSATLVLTTTGGSCGSVNTSKTQLVGTAPNSITISPASATICNNTVQALTASNTYTTSASSGTVNLAIPSFSNTGVSSTLAIAGIPATATITGISVTFNSTHPKVSDLIMNLRAPNGNVLNLANRPNGGNGANFTNTVVSSASSTAFSTSSAPFTGTFRADATNGIGATGQTSNVTAFSSLYSTTNGNWVLSAKDGVSLNSGTLVSWSITITYSDAVTWAPVTNLYTDATATTAYTGTNATTVYFKASSGITSTYTATATNTSGCSTSGTTTVTSGPTVSITTDYCYGGGYIQLTANSSPSATSWLWNTGATTQSILVDLAGLYQVTATSGSCIGTAVASIAQELVVNGDFSSGNVGFTSSYAYINPAIVNGLYPEATYSVSANPTVSHNMFFGRDHTSNTGNFMVINGAGSPVSIWTETFAVQPNTTYYFSAWAISLNNVSPYAQLQFDVNGSALGTTAVLAAGPTNNNPPYNWVRFYGNWTSGAGVTSATVSIKDLQTALGGNDFGLDDISFGTLSTFITHTSTLGSDSQMVCKNTPMVDNIYAVGSGSAGPTVTGLPAGVTSSFNGVNLTISGTPTVIGNYTYTISTTGTCNPVTVHGFISVVEDSLTLSSAAGTDNQTICRNVAMTNITYHLGVSASGATVTGLPGGVSGSYSNGTFTISGTPTVAAVYNYSVTTTGGCIPVTLNGTITVVRQTITRTSAVGTNSQHICINTALTNITYSVTGTATGAGVTGLPAGVTGVYNAGVFTISGTPTVGGVFNYLVTTTGTCMAATATGTITVNYQYLALNSAAGTDAQSVCNNSAISAISYTIGGSATSASVSATLPPGVSGSYSSGLFTISGTATATGVYSYTVTTSGTCSPAATATGTITVGQQTIGLSSAAGTNAQTLCINSAITNITYAVGGVATGAGVTGLPAGVSGSYSSGVFTITGTATAAGTFNYTVTTTGSCGAAPATANGSITVSPAAAGGTIADVSICYADNGNLTLTGSVGAVTRWETSTDLSGWTNIVNTTTTQSFTGLTQTTWYRALVQSGACASASYSNSAKVGIHNLWTGATSSDWNTGSNWSDGQTPTTSCPDVTIPLLTLPNLYPQLTSGTATVNNIVIHPNATMLVSGANLQVAGTITNNGTLDITNGTLELNGSSGAQTIAGSVFSTHTIDNLIISNSNGVSFANTNDTVKITGVLSFGANNAVLNTNNNLTLVSNATGTASVADLTNGGLLTGTNVSGNVTVERYIPVHPKAWQFLSTPTSGQSIQNAWQEGNATLGNNNPGYGTIITGEMAGATGLGFDIYTPTGASMKTFNSTNNTWVGVVSTTMQIANKKGYMFFIRGDRSVTAYNQTATATTLRTTGKLYTFGADAPASISVPAGKTESVGNPYASSIDFRLISKPASPAVDDVFYVWDPLLTNNYFGLGGYQTLSAANGWKPIPGGTANYDVNVANPYIQSGQAFLMHATGAGGTVTFAESNKVNQYTMVNRPVTRSADRKFMRLYLYNASSMLSDGNVVAFDSEFSNDYDANDALKIANSGENISIVKGDKLLALEARRPVTAQDTVFYTFGNIRRAAYQLRFAPENLATEGLTATLLDKFLHTSTTVSLNDTSSYDFSITTDAGSWALDRFCLVFNQSPLAAITSITANRNTGTNTISVNWTTEHESNIQQYEVQRSTDGSNYQSITEALPTGNNNSTYAYTATDRYPSRGINFYRIKAQKDNGNMIYSAVVRVVPGKNDAMPQGRSEGAGRPTDNDINAASVNIYPNPSVNKLINVQFIKQAKGMYRLELFNKLGEPVYTKSVEINSNNSVETIHLERTIAAGNYQLKITAPGNSLTVKQVIIQ